MKLVRHAALVVTCCGLLAAPATAETRHGAVADPSDVPESLNGPRQPDIEAVRLDYDDTGTISVTVRLFAPWSATTQAYPIFGISLGSAVESSDYGCSSFNAGDVNLTGYLDPKSSLQGYISVVGYDGSLPVQRSVSPDGLETTFAVSATPLGGRNYICGARPELVRPDSTGHCSPSLSNCKTISYGYTGDTASDFFFEGHQPVHPACDDGLDNDGDGKTDLNDPDCDDDSTKISEGQPPAACANKRDDDGDGKVDLADPGCRGSKRRGSEVDPAPVASTIRISSLAPHRNCELDVGVIALPDLHPVKLFAFGKIELTVAGIGGAGTGYRTVRHLPVAASDGYGFTLKPGRYRLSARYLGDAFRKPSAAPPREVSVC